MADALNFSNGKETDEAFFSASGQETADALFNGAGQETDYRNFNTAGQETQDAQFNTSTDKVSDVIQYSNGAEQDELFYNPSGQLTQSDTFSGGYTDVNLFNPGAPYAYQTTEYASGSGMELQSALFNQNTGQLTQVSLFNGGPYAYETEFANGGGYYDEIETFNSSTGQETGYATFNSTTGQEIGAGGTFANSYYSDGYDDYSGDYFGNYGYDFSGGYYGFAGKQSTINQTLGSNIGSIAQYDLAQGDTAGAAAAEAGRGEAAQAASQSALTGGQGNAVLEAAKWDGNVITWSLADSAGTGSAQFSSYMGRGYEAEVQQAFASWAAASGLRFEEVSDSSQSDIRIGFGDFDTADTGVVGFTSFEAQDGVMSPGAIIRVEDPTEDALTTGADGQQIYAGTDATLEQILEHEIGHALGLASNSDANSIMYYALNSNNRTLDATDIAGIQCLYGQQVGTATASRDDLRVSRLIQAMSSYDAPESASSLLTSVGATNPELYVAAH